MGWHLLKINLQCCNSAGIPKLCNAARKRTNYTALPQEKKKSRDYSGSQVEHESTGSCCCKNSMHHSQVHKQEYRLQVRHREICCLHLLQQDVSWRIVSFEHHKPRGTQTACGVWRTVTRTITGLENTSYAVRARTA